MGLDLYLMKKVTSEAFNWDEEPLSYGRRTWSIFRKFAELGASVAGDIKYDEIYNVSPEVYERFIVSIYEAMDSSNLTSRKLRKAIHTIEKNMDSEKFSKKVCKAKRRLSKFRNAWTDIPDEMGELCEVKTILDWLEARDEVRELFKDPKIRIFLIAAY